MKEKSIVLWILRRIRRRIPALVLMTTAHIFQALLGVAFALGTRQIIDYAVDGNSGGFRLACVQQVVIICLVLLCLTVYRHLRDRLRADLDRDWKKELLHGLLHGDYSAVSAYHTGELMNRLNNDVRTVNDGLLNVFPNVTAMAVRLVASMVVLMGIEPWFGLAVLFAGLMVMLVTGLMRSRLKSLTKIVSQKDGKVSGYIQELLEKLLIVQGMNLSHEVERRADGLLQDRYEAQRQRKNVALLANTGVSILTYGAGFVALVWSSGLLLLGTISFGSLTAITQLVSQLQTPFVGLSGVVPQYIAMMASAERLRELETIQGDSEDPAEESDDLYVKMDAICGSGLWFSYDRDNILSGADFVVPKGSFAAITGSSGVGKSTLLKLLLGIYSPQSGELFARCNDGDEKLDRSTRSLFAYVPQGNLIFSGTLRENLTITKPDANEEMLENAMQISAVTDFLPELPDGLDTILGENGVGLSEGQLQRVAIARAVLSGAPILLLDECTSALDSDTERRVLTRLKEIPNRTCIAVTHRLAARELCDLHIEVADGMTVSKVK